MQWLRGERLFLYKRARESKGSICACIGVGVHSSPHGKKTPTHANDVTKLYVLRGQLVEIICEKINDRDERYLYVWGTQSKHDSWYTSL